MLAETGRHDAISDSETRPVTGIPFSEMKMLFYSYITCNTGIHEEKVAS